MTALESGTHDRANGVHGCSTVRFAGYGHYRPRRAYTTQELVDSSTPTSSGVEDAVVGHIGVDVRNLADEQETVVVMGAAAGTMALKDAGVDPADVDLVILANWTQRQWIPDLAPQLSLAMGVLGAFSFDISTACFGFVHGVVTARAFMVASPERYRRALVVCSERFSDRVRPGSKGELIVADGAGAVLLELDGSGRTGVLDYVEDSRGHLADVVGLKLPEGWVRSQLSLAQEVSDSTFRHITDLLVRNDVGVDDLDWFVPHPGTAPVHEALVDRLSMSWAKVLINFATTANLSAASIPLLLSELRQEGRVQDGQLVLIAAVGSGFYAGGLLVRV